MTKTDFSQILSYEHYGEILGSVIVAACANRIGRKKCLLGSVVPTLISWAIVAFQPKIWVLKVSMLLRGLSVGGNYTLSPIYTSEIAEAKYRGRLGALLGLAWSSGTLYTYFLGSTLSYKYYLLSGFIPAVLFLLVFSMMPESPYYLMMVNKEEETIRVLTWLRGKPVPEEVENVKQSVQEDLDSGASPFDIFSKKHLHSLVIMLAMAAFKYLAGICAIESYSTQSLTLMKIPRPDVGTTLLGVILLCASLTASNVFDIFGRRTIMVYGMLFMTVDNLFVFLFPYFTLLPQWTLCVALALLIFSIKLGIGTVCEVIVAEYFPCHVRPCAGVLNIVISNVFMLISLNIYQLFEDKYGPYSNFLFFAIVSFIGLIILVPNMKETAKLSLRDIQLSNCECSDEKDVIT